MTGEGIRKKRDPIFSVCFVVFVVACVGVLGGYVYDNYIDEDETKVAFGDKVEVNYTGAYYAFPGEDGAVIFDTSLSSIGNDKDLDKSYSFNKTKFETLSFTVGDKTMIEMFENSTIGHKVGDKYTIMIPAEDAYNQFPAGSIHKDVSTTQSIDVVQIMTVADFEEIYGKDVKLKGGVSVFFTSAYGWDATATLDNTNNMVSITNMPVAGQEYQYIGNDDSKYGKVSFTTKTNGDKIEVTYHFVDTVKVDDGIQMIELNLDGEPIYITAVNGDTMSYKTCQERNDIDLYFEIEIVSITPNGTR